MNELALKDHYLLEDWPQVLDEIEKLMNTSIKGLHMAENAEFSSKKEILIEFERSLNVLHSLNCKKIHRDDIHASEHLRRHMF